MSKLHRFFRFISSKQSLSESLSWGIDRNYGKMRPKSELRNDCRDIPVCEGVYVQVYWKRLKLGKGPALSLFMLDEEILRIDCFGKGAGHMHVAFFLPHEGENRLWMHESTIADQIERARFELYRNHRYYQCRIPNPNIRAIKLDREKMKAVSEQAYEIMRGFAEGLSAEEVDHGYEAYGSEID